MSGIKTFVQSDLRVAPTEQNHLVRLQDMMEYVAGLTKSAVRVVMDTPFISTYDAPTLTLTQTTAADLIVDGVTLDLGDRVLVAAQADATQNGIYTVTTLGDTTNTIEAVLTRASDFNTSADIVQGTIVPVTEGTANANSRWKLTPATIPATLDVTALNFEKDVTDFSKVVEYTYPIVADNSTTVYPIAHNLNTLYLTHEIYEDATGETVIAEFARTDVNTAQVTFGAPLGTGNDLTLIIHVEVNPS